MERCDVKVLLENDWHGGGPETGACQEYITKNNMERSMKEDKRLFFRVILFQHPSSAPGRLPTVLLILQMTRISPPLATTHRYGGREAGIISWNKWVMIFLMKIERGTQQQLQSRCFISSAVAVYLIIFPVWRSACAHLCYSCCIISQQRPAVPSLDD